eukprot:CAMPEP_0206559840 /NCGR_PEP_ID=MMETSP0325_2-20121206/20650_1 /ASSEMBLY_ACC=CAM_ASM_000347 /TAXON_ID=2866 /ORGANISM="Crypthecodinium cohnii, Strain Seligo" /LENGTH=31 /DNA_ID= /DNA_START= /DNA_END= /DNA_ORIENTATION=
MPKHGGNIAEENQGLKARRVLEGSHQNGENE